MNRVALAVVTFFLLIVTRFADLFTTFYFSPSLDREANPLVALVGGGSASLIGASVIEVILLSAGLITFWRGSSLPLRSLPAASGWKFAQGWMSEVIGPRDSFLNWLPRRSRWQHSVQAIRLVSVALSWAIILGGLASVYSWVALAGIFGPRSKTALGWFAFGSVPSFPYLAAILGFAFGTVLFFLSESRAAMSGAARASSLSPDHSPGSFDSRTDGTLRPPFQ